ncbi:MAG TPA: Arc family DNA-binding protein [Candidatus Phocaeicola excrementigallinarum]|nr:Arc family DNA-binding protein [Candidatus Phocaeicola excrementigallinarum]
MEATVKRQTAFRLDSELLEKLKSAAKREHRSLNNYVECILREVMYSEPNETTKTAIEEARAGKYAGTVDTSSMDAFIKSCE